MVPSVFGGDRGGESVFDNTKVRQLTEALLSCSVPNLQLYTFSIKFNRTNLEVNPTHIRIALFLLLIIILVFVFFCKRIGFTHPMVVIKLGVKESSENLSNKQLLPTPTITLECCSSTGRSGSYRYPQSTTA